MSGILQTLFLGAAAAVKDAYFNLVTLLLNTTATNGAQNNTFLDSSTNNFSITRNGNATQGTFTPFSQTGWGNYLDSNNNQGLSYPTTANTLVGCPAGTKLTYEFWVYCTGILPTTGYYMGFMGASPSVGVNGRWTINFIGSSTTSDQYMYYYWTTSPGSADTATSTVPLKQNQWNHIAICIDATTASNSTIVIYQNGVGQTFTGKDLSSQTTANDPGYQQYIGGRRNDGLQTYNGYVSNLRVVRGSLVYTSNFTPPTQPLTAITGTVLLTCQSNRFIDNSSYNWTMGAVSGDGTTGTPSAQAFSPFAPAYITPTTYSNYFDGSGDYLTAPNAAWMNLGTNSFTMECWVQFNTVSLTQMLVSNNYNAGTGGGGWAFLYRQDNTTLKFTCNSNVSYEKTWSPVVGTMYHVAVCRSGTDLRLFVNGTQIGTTSTSSDNISGASSTLVVGNNLGGTPLPINGVISNMRIVTSALYTSNFTPPTAPLTAVSNTQLLTCQNSTFIDNSTNAATLTANGNVQPVASPTPFAPTVETEAAVYSTTLVGGSYYGDGSGDYLVNNSNSLQIASSTNFTFECWLYRQSTFTGDQGTCFFAIGSESANRIQFTMFGSQIRVEVYAGTLDFYGGFVPLNAWTHVAIVRTGGSTMSIYINGVFATSASWSSVVGNTGGFIIGANRSVSNYVNGYISGLRLINGTALYTSNFTPPLAPPTAVTNTQLLTNFTNAGIYDAAAKNDLETVGNAQVSTTQAKFGTTSMYFDGTGDYLRIPSVSAPPLYNMGTGDYTVEMFVYLNTVSGLQCLIDFRGSDTTGQGVAFYLNGTTLYIYYNGSNRISYSSMATGSWYHVCYVRNNGVYTMYVNGTSAGTWSNSDVVAPPANFPIIGEISSLSGFYLNGYIDELRITKGYARYTANFTPPAAAFPVQ